MFANLRNNQSGSVIVISMIILIVVAAIVSTLALIVVNNLRYVQSYSQAQQSYFTAETALEQGLYYTQAARTAKTIDTTALATLVTTVASTANNYDIEFTTNDETNLVIPLTDQATQQINLYAETYNVGGYVETTPLDIGSLIIQWSPVACTEYGHINSVELSDTAWNANSWSDAAENPDNQTRWVYDGYSCDSAGDGCSHRLQADFLHKVRFKSLYCAIDDFTVSATDAARPGQYLPLQKTVMLTGTGRHGKTQQQITAKVLWQSPLINYFDYVLFSEETVTK